MMRKKLYFLLLLILVPGIGRAQWTNKTMSFGGNSRQYRIYLPAGYNPASTYPLVMTLHGLGDNMTNFSAIGMNVIADTAKFIVVVPQAVTDPLLGMAAWNSGAGMMGLYPNANVNDVAFLKALIDTVSTQYPVNADRVYACGFSMGGYMTQRLGCELGDKFAAIASVSGTIGNGLGACNPLRILPVLHIHGTQDETVPYTNNNSGIDADSLVRFWVKKNNCSNTPVHITLPDIAADGLTVDHYTYTGTAPAAVVEHFKVNGGGHVWLTQNKDINYPVEIWRFFRRYQLTQPTSVADITEQAAMRIYPNPASTKLHVEIPFPAAKLRLFSLSGRLMLEQDIAKTSVLSLDGISSGIYLLNVQTKVQSFFQKVILEK